MSFEKYLNHKKAVVISLDDALFPKKDYLLQVYYLFAEFIEYSEQIDAKAILSFMSEEYAERGEHDIFAKTAAKFNIPEKYEHNFNLLFETARLPLKLLLFKNVLEFLQEAVVDRRQIFIVAEGNPAEAVSKIKQIEWNGLEAYLKLYFTAEYDNSIEKTIEGMLADQKIDKEEVVALVSAQQLGADFKNSSIDCFSVTEIL